MTNSKDIKIQNINIGLKEIERQRQYYEDNMFSKIYVNYEHECSMVADWLDQEREYLLEGWNNVDAFQRRLKNQIYMSGRVKSLKSILKKIYANDYK